LTAGRSGDHFRAGIERALALGWQWWHESGTYAKFTDAITFGEIRVAVGFDLNG